jgi:hypothetical protein
MSARVTLRSRVIDDWVAKQTSVKPPLDVRSWQILLQKSPQEICEIKFATIESGRPDS